MDFFPKLLQILDAHGVQRIFGVPGDAINPLLEALRTQHRIQYIHVSHEESGALAASAAAKVSGNLQVCAGTVGPGALHLLNGLYDAKKDRAPVLAIVGQVPSEFLGNDYHQEVNLGAVFHDVAGYLAEVRHPEQMPAIAIEACNRAVADRAVSVLIVPHDMGKLEVPDLPVSAVQTSQLGRMTAPQEILEEAAAKINATAKVTLFVGDGARQGREAMLQLAEHLKAPIVFSLKGKDIVPAGHPCTAGGIGLLGSRSGVHAMDSCDVLLVLGTDFPYREWYNADCDVIQVDARAAIIGRRRPGATALHCDVEVAARWLMDNTRAKDDEAHLAHTRRVKKEWDAYLHHLEGRTGGHVIHPQVVAKTLSDLADERAIFTCDTGEVTVWGARHLDLKPQQRFAVSFNLATMAFAMPAALGLQSQYPDRQVISMSGDGGFNMLMGDFLTAVKYSLPIKVVVFNNGKLGLIKMEQEVEGYPEHETDLQNPDYAALADAMGGTGFSVKSPGELADVLGRALAQEGPVIVDVPVNPNELVMPPKIKASQAIGYGLAKIRELL